MWHERISFVYFCLRIWSCIESRILADIVCWDNEMICTLEAELTDRSSYKSCSWQYCRTCWINNQCRSIPINAGSDLWHWHQCRSININVDQWKSKPINTSQFSSMPIHFRSIPQIWSGIDRYWSVLIIETACPDIEEYLIRQPNSPLSRDKIGTERTG